MAEIRTAILLAENFGIILKTFLSDDEITDGGVTLNDGHSITFSCSYSLAPHSVSQYSSVHGHDSSAARNKTSVGGLGYRLVVDDGFIGNRVNFSVIPVNPGLVHSRIKNCIVSSQKNPFSYIIFGKNDQYCMDSITNFEIMNEYESTTTQKFSYTGFKWDTSQAISLQTLRRDFKQILARRRSQAMRK